MSQEWDAIVIGSGMGGLVCAAYLAASGRRVLVLEQHDVAGGNGHVFRRRRRYEFDVGMHYLGDCGPGGLLPAILHGLGLDGRVPFARLDRDGFDRIVLPGLTFDVPEGWDRYLDRLCATFPAEERGLREYARICSAVASANRDRLLDRDGDDRLARDWATRTLARLFGHCGLSTRARAVLAAESGNYGAAPSEVLLGVHAGMIDDYLRGSFYPEGGGQVLVAALVEFLESHGGTLRTRARVRTVDVEDGTVRGVRLAGGEALRAPLVVSNADFRRTVLELLDGRYPPMQVRRTRQASMRLPTATLYLALDKEIEVPRANIWYWPDADIEAAYANLERPDWTPPFAFCSFTSAKDPHSPRVCPPGHTNFQIVTVCPRGPEPWGMSAGPAEGARYRRDPGYQKAKRRLTDSLLELAEAAIGPFRGRLTHQETATPLTQERYTRSTGGAAYGLARWGFPGGRPDVVTPVHGLYLAGGNTRYGTGIGSAAVSGIACASAILGRALLPEAHAGAVFGNPDLLPVRGADWDPLAVSRGAARRSARGLARVGAP
ncbi:phytoene desaturase family protein [Sciscionella sediminilitoris]|uniref:phytoene desaturase family protein n=1 Tax=Sciscionella sediminilitoris TaxID=1445613 RepID=UPI0004DF0C52|nr:NAD(P)/FAD-dependent oxidoreductase [Sciscionella sp. SE31]